MFLLTRVSILPRVTPSVLVQRELDKSTFPLRDIPCLWQGGFFRHNKALNGLCS
jgi:hypothetical protein